MSRFELQRQQPRPMTRPFSDWQADVERQIERRTGMRLIGNHASNAYWMGEFHCGVSPQEAADDFIADWRKGETR